MPASIISLENRLSSTLKRERKIDRIALGNAALVYGAPGVELLALEHQSLLLHWYSFLFLNFQHDDVNQVNAPYCHRETSSLEGPDEDLKACILALSSGWVGVLVHVDNDRAVRDLDRRNRSS